MGFNYRTFRKNLRDLAEDEHGNLSRFEKRLAIPHSTMSKWLKEGGEQIPNGYQLQMIVNKTGVSLDWLLYGVGPKKLGSTRTKQELASDLHAYLTGEVLRRVDPRLGPMLFSWTSTKALLEKLVRAEVQYAEAVLRRAEELRALMGEEAEARRRRYDIYRFPHKFRGLSAEDRDAVMVLVHQSVGGQVRCLVGRVPEITLTAPQTRALEERSPLTWPA